MVKHAPPVEVVDEFEQWEAEALQKAQQAVDEGMSVEHGMVVDADPRLRYAIVEDEPTGSPTVLAHRARVCLRLEKLGYRLQEGKQVIGYSAAKVYAMPMRAYRSAIGRRRHNVALALQERYPKQVGIMRPQVSQEYEI